MANTPLLLSGAETGDKALETQTSAGTNGIVTSPVRAGSGARVYQTNPTLTATGSFTLSGFSATTGKIVALGISATAFSSFYFRADTLPAATHEIIAGYYTVLTTATPVATLRITSAGLLAVYDSAGLLITTGTTALSTGTWYKLDFSANRTTGAWAVQINNVAEISGSGATLGATNIGNLSIGKIANTNGNTVNFYYDDIWIDSVGFAPSTYGMVIDKPTANGTTMSWTTSDSGVGDFSHVNTVPAQTSTFVEDPAGTSLPVVAEFAMQTFAQMGITGATPLAIQTFCYLKDTATIANTAKQGILSNVTLSTNSTAQNTSAAFVNFGRVLGTDPNGGGAWGQSGIENLQFYVEEATTAVNTQLAAALITVAYVPAVVTSSVKQLAALGCG